MLLQDIGMGGVSRWAAGLIRQSTIIDWTGIAVTRDLIDPVVVRQIAPVPVYSADGNHEGVTYVGSLEKAVSCVSEAADILIHWGHPDIRPMRKLMPALVIETAHGDNESTAGRVETNMKPGGAQWLITVSRTVAHRMPVDLAPITSVLPNGVEVDRITPRFGREAVRGRWQIQKDEKILSYIGRLSQEKNPLAAVRAAAVLGPEWSVMFVGDGRDRQELEQASSQYAPNKIYFHPPVYQVGDVLAAADVFIFPSKEEGFGLSLVEAWLANLPVAASDIPVVREFESYHGQLCHKFPVDGSPQQIAAAVRTAYVDGKQVPKSLVHSIQDLEYGYQLLIKTWKS